MVEVDLLGYGVEFVQVAQDAFSLGREGLREVGGEGRAASWYAVGGAIATVGDGVDGIVVGGADVELGQYAKVMALQQS